MLAKKKRTEGALVLHCGVGSFGNPFRLMEELEQIACGIPLHSSVDASRLCSGGAWDMHLPRHGDGRVCSWTSMFTSFRGHGKLPSQVARLRLLTVP